MGWLLPGEWQVPEEFVARLGESAGRQRAMTADGHLLLVLHQAPTLDTAERKGRFFWRDLAGDWRSSSLGDGTQALKRHLAEFAERVDELEKQWQVAQSARDYFLLLQAIAPLHRTVRHLHATLQQARDLAPDERELINARDRAGEIERALELLHGDARNGLDFTVAQESEHQSERMYEMAVSQHRLNLLAALFFPIATIGAAFEILSHEAHELGKAFFWSTLLLGIGCGLALSLVILRKPASKTPAARPTKVRGKRVIGEKRNNSVGSPAKA
jgi:hypothetical protein